MNLAIVAFAALAFFLLGELVFGWHDGIVIHVIKIMTKRHL